jgi:hypothetical protein
LLEAVYCGKRSEVENIHTLLGRIECVACAELHEPRAQDFVEIAAADPMVVDGNVLLLSEC